MITWPFNLKVSSSRESSRLFWCLSSNKQISWTLTRKKGRLVDFLLPLAPRTWTPNWGNNKKCTPPQWWVRNEIFFLFPEIFPKFSERERNAFQNHKFGTERERKGNFLPIFFPFRKDFFPIFGGKNLGFGGKNSRIGNKIELFSAV